MDATVKGCEYCRGEKPLTDKVYDDGTRFDDLHGTRIEKIGEVPVLVSYVPPRYFDLFMGLHLSKQTKEFMSCKWAVDIDYCPKCGARLHID